MASTHTTPKSTGKKTAGKPAGRKPQGATEKPTTAATAPKATPDSAAFLTQARVHYGCSPAALMGRLKADGYDGKTLAERLARWADARQTAADASGQALADALASVEPVAPEPADVPAADLEPVAPAAQLEPAAPLTLPEPELIAPADVPAVVAGAAPIVPTMVAPVPRPTVQTGRSGKATDLHDAHRQWANRPADERYWTIADALSATQHHKETAREVVFQWKDCALQPTDDGKEIALCLPDGTQATLTNYSAKQLCQDVGAPHAYLSKLPTELAVACLEDGMARTLATVNKRGEPKSANALVHQNGHTKLRSITSDKYARFWNCEVFEALEPLTDAGWRTPPARPTGPNDPRSRRAEPADCLKRSGEFWGTVKPGEWIAPAGIYASDHDMFAFLINEDMRIDDGTPDGLARGFFVSNSEVGAGALKLKAFWYRDVCSNHIVWGAEHVVEVNVRHVGTWDSIREKFKVQVRGALDSFTSASLADAQAVINRAREFMLTTESDPVKARKDVLHALISGVSGGRTLKPASGISVGMFDKAIDYAIQFQDIDHVHPFSLWGCVNGLTRYSQSADVGADYADERARVDSLTAKLMKLVGADSTPVVAV